MICMIDLLYSIDRGWRISNDKVVMNKGLLLEAICKTAMRACGPGLRICIDSLRADVARVKSDRSASIASKCCCQMSKPREQRSIASTRYGDESSYRYNDIDLAISVIVLNKCSTLDTISSN